MYFAFIFFTLHLVAKIFDKLQRSAIVHQAIATWNWYTETVKTWKPSLSPYPIMKLLHAYYMNAASYIIKTAPAKTYLTTSQPAFVYLYVPTIVVPSRSVHSLTGYLHRALSNYCSTCPFLFTAFQILHIQEDPFIWLSTYKITLSLAYPSISVFCFHAVRFQLYNCSQSCIPVHKVVYLFTKRFGGLAAFAKHY